MEDVLALIINLFILFKGNVFNATILIILISVLDLVNHVLMVTDMIWDMDNVDQLYVQEI
jgi:hypothetical protein